MKKTVKLLFLLFLLWEVTDNLFLFKKCLIRFSLYGVEFKSYKSCNSAHESHVSSANYLPFKNLQRLKFSELIEKKIHLHGSISSLFSFFSYSEYGHLKDSHFKTLNGPVPFILW